MAAQGARPGPLPQATVDAAAAVVAFQAGVFCLLLPEPPVLLAAVMFVLAAPYAYRSWRRWRGAPPPYQRVGFWGVTATTLLWALTAVYMEVALYLATREWKWIALASLCMVAFGAVAMSLLLDRLRRIAVP